MVTLIIGVLLVIAIIQIVRYKLELRHMAQFLMSRDRTKSATLKAQLQTHEMRKVVSAINNELANHKNEYEDLKRHQKEFQADLAHLSHDIRTPLTGARGYVQLLENEENIEKRTHYHKAVTRRLEDLNYMLDQLFIFTQVTDPEYSVEIEKIDANEIMSEALLSLYPQFKEKKIEPLVQLEERLDVVADKEALRRIILNLVTNVLRHGTGNFSIVQQKTAYVFANTVPDPSLIEVNRLFERFYKADPNRSGEGSGLGLAIVYQLAETMGASVAATLEDDVLSITLNLKEH